VQAWSINKLQEIWAEKRKSKTSPVSFADGIGKAKDLNFKIYLFETLKYFKNFVPFSSVQNF